MLLKVQSLKGTLLRKNIESQGLRGTDSQREELLAQIRQKDAVIESLLRQVIWNPSISLVLHVLIYVFTPLAERTD